jgi:hypothetical protein
MSSQCRGRTELLNARSPCHSAPKGGSPLGAVGAEESLWHGDRAPQSREIPRSARNDKGYARVVLP